MEGFIWVQGFRWMNPSWLIGSLATNDRHSNWIQEGQEFTSSTSSRKVALPTTLDPSLHMQAS